MLLPVSPYDLRLTVISLRCALCTMHYALCTSLHAVGSGIRSNRMSFCIYNPCLPTGRRNPQSIIW
jgi:hypothetical protein